MASLSVPHALRLGVLAITLLLVSACSLANEDEVAIRENFEAYRVSLIDRDGELALSLVSRSTIEYYARLREMALYGDSVTLANATLTDRLAIYKYRAEWTGEDLLALTAEETFILAIENGWVGSNLGALEIDTVRVFGDSATSNIKSNGQTAPFGFTFHREDGIWRIDLASIMNIANAAMVHQIEETGMTELEFVDFFVRSSGYAGGADERILNPLIAGTE